MKRIILFSRTSTTEQDVEQQTKVLIAEAERIGYSKDRQIIIEYQESATKLDIETRKGIQKLKDTISNDSSIDCMMCWELTRIARRTDVIYSIRNFLIEHKICWIVLKPSYMELIDRNGTVTPTMSLMLGVFAAFAESEMRIKSDRFARAKQQLRNDGKKFAGAVVWGYIKNTDKSIGLHPLRSKIISELFNYYANNEHSSVSKTYEWAVSHYPSEFPVLPYNKAKRRMQTLLTNNKYWLGDWCYQPIISKELGEKVQEKMHKGKCMPRFNTKFDYLGRGLLICRHCGHILTPAAGRTFAYICPTDKSHSITININIIEQLIWEETNVLANINASLGNTERIKEINSSIIEKENIISNNKERLSALDERYNRLVTLYLDNRIPQQLFDKQNESIQADIDNVKKTITTLTASVNELNGLLKGSQDVLNPKSINFDNLDDFETKLQLVHQYIDKIYVEKIKPRVYSIEFTYKSCIFIVQRGLYRYEGFNQKKKLFRINQDGTEDLI